MYLLALCDGLTPDEFRAVCARLSIPGRLASRLCDQRHTVFTTLRTIKRHLKQDDEVRNSQLFDWFSDLDVELLLYLAARASSEQVRRLASLYLTRLRTIVPLLRGEDLHALGLEPGPLFGRIMERLQQARLDGEVHSREEEIVVATSLAEVWVKHGNGC